MKKDTQIIAFANNKGGVGKTTSVAAIGVLLARKGYRTLMVDLDSQCSLTECFLPAGMKTENIYTLLTSTLGNLPDAIVHGEEFQNPEPGLDLIPSTPETNELDSILAGKTNREMLLSRVFKALNINRRYDVVLIDCPPSLSLLTQNALVASTGLLVPTTAEYMPLMGLQKIRAKCLELSEYFQPGVNINAILITHFNASKNLHTAVDDALREHYGNIVFKTRIRENVRLAECPQFRKPIFDYAPDSNGAADYTKVFEEFLKKFELI